VPIRDYDIPLHIYAGRLSPINSVESIRPEASGVGLNDKEAMSSFLGEAVERYSWLSLIPDKVIIEKESNLKENYLPIEETNFIINEKVTFNNFIKKLKEIEIPWLVGKKLSTSKKILIPAVDLLGYLIPNKDFQNLTTLTTNGIAAGTSFSYACLNAICELIERDAVMQFWYSQGENIDAMQSNLKHDGMEKIIAKCNSLNLQYTTLDITTDLGVPTCFTFLYRNEEGNECLTCGAASNMSEKEASRKSLLEALAMWKSALTIKASKKDLTYDEVKNNFVNINSFEDHVFLYTHPWAREGYSFLTSKKYIKKIE